MDTMSAFIRGQASRGKELMVFDWEKAANLIKERKPHNVSAGLRGDWEWTGGEIYKNGKIIPKNQTYVFLASTWAVPEIDIDGDILPCYKMQHEVPRWGSHTYFPKKAKDILTGGI